MIFRSGRLWSPSEALAAPRRHIVTQDNLYSLGDYASAHSSNVWAAVKLAIFSPVHLSTAASVTKFFQVTGGTANGNIDVGLFAPDGTMISSTGSTAQGTASTVQFINPSGGTFSIGPGTYYLGVTSDSATPTSTYRGTAINAQLGRVAGLYQQTTLYPLANATFASLTNTMWPVIGMQADQIPNSYRPVTPTVISPFSILATVGSATYNGQINLSAATSGAWPAANRALYYPIFIPAPLVLAQAFVMAGATWTGTNHFDIGLYAADGTKIFTTGATTSSGTTNTLQVVDHTDFEIGAGMYFMALALDSTDTVFRYAINTAAILGAQQQASAYPLPSPATFTASTTGYLPVFGFTTQAVI